MQDFLKIEDYSCGYETKAVLHQINHSFRRGGFTGIIGPNGSGKTTLFKGISGTLKPMKGAILLNGKNLLSGHSIKMRAQNIAIVTQQIEGTFIKVEDYVLMGRLPYHSRFQLFETKKDYEVAHKYLELTNTYRLKNMYMNELSGGEQQLAEIARALAQEPALLLLDEPTSHLDITHQVQILNLIQKLNRESGLTVIMVIHDLNLASEYCDELVMLNNGRINKSGTPEEVLTYQIIEEVYKTLVVVEKNPLSGKPIVLLVSGKAMEKV